MFIKILKLSFCSIWFFWSKFICFWLLYQSIYAKNEPKSKTWFVLKIIIKNSKRTINWSFWTIVTVFQNSSLAFISNSVVFYTINLFLLNILQYPYTYRMWSIVTQCLEIFTYITYGYITLRTKIYHLLSVIFYIRVV